MQSDQCMNKVLFIGSDVTIKYVLYLKLSSEKIDLQMPEFGLGTQWSTTKLTCLYSKRLTAKLDFSISSPVKKAFVLLHGFPWEKASSEEFCMTQKQNIWSWKEYINAFRQFCLTRKCHINFRQKSKYGKTKFLTEKVSFCKIKKNFYPLKVLFEV